MKNNEYEIDIIELYLKGELSEDERLAIAERIATDSDFAAEVALVKDTLKTVNVGENLRVRELFENIAAEVKDEKTTIPLEPPTVSHTPPAVSNPPFFKWVAIGVGVALLLALAAYFVDKANKATPADLYAQYYEVYPSPSVARGNVDINTMWVEGIEFYENGEYLKAVVNWESIIEENDGEGNYLTYFYIGMALLENGNAADAIPYLQKVLISDNDYRQQAEWYLVMAYLKTGEGGLAILQLQQIAINLDHYKRVEAEEILRELQK